MSRIKLRLPVKIREYLVQSVLLAFSVLLALVLNEWRQTIKTNNVVDRVKASLLNEVKSNKTNVESALEYHKELIKNLVENSHLVTSFPKDRISVDWSKPEKTIKEELYQTILLMNQEIPSGYELMKIEEDHFKVKMNGLTITLKIENDSIKFYGRSGIQLKQADIVNTTWQTAQATNSLVHLEYRVVALFSDIYQSQDRYIRLADKIIEMLYKGDQGIIPALQDLRNTESELLEMYDEMIRLLEL